MKMMISLQSLRTSTLSWKFSFEYSKANSKASRNSEEQSKVF